MYDGLEHSCIEDNHIVNIFSFSKAYGMMGWRVGYIAYPTEVEGFRAQLLKVQDNIPICPSIIGQHLALYSLEVGPEWIRERVQDLVRNRELLKRALLPLGEESVKGGEGAIYLWAKLPEKYSDDFEVVRWLLRKHGVVVIPGSASGGAGYIRISFGGLKEADCEVAAERLRNGLEELVRDGMIVSRTSGSLVYLYLIRPRKILLGAPPFTPMARKPTRTIEGSFPRRHVDPAPPTPSHVNMPLKEETENAHIATLEECSCQIEEHPMLRKNKGKPGVHNPARMQDNLPQPTLHRPPVEHFAREHHIPEGELDPQLSQLRPRCTPA
ncbi:hypothetical protein KSP40_PGU016008 [Platanthera guangdongensis]|uniref:Aminotransferase class I/classII large domain-containing protein n=1 Tax=Platanthera guangdongensis TaxID=2320717 RepID=A0ABR2LYV9_9ASPA